MADKETFLQSKLISQKAKKFRNLSLVLATVGILGFILSYVVTNSCNIKQVSIMSDIQKFENSPDPEFCASLVDRILEYNDECEPYFEILDCG